MSYLNALFSESETKIGRKAFNKLCESGCTRSTLGGLLIFLCAPDRVIITRPDKERSLQARPKYEVSLRPLDRHKSLEALFGGYDLRKLRQVAKTATKLQEQLERLRNTEGVRHLTATGELPDNDLLSASSLVAVLGLPDSRFCGILNLPELAKGLSPKNRPDYTRLLTKIYVHIRQQTGVWHDKEVADMLNDLLPNDPTQHDEVNLKAWRARHSLTDAPRGRPAAALSRKRRRA